MKVHEKSPNNMQNLHAEKSMKQYLTSLLKMDRITGYGMNLGMTDPEKLFRIKRDNAGLNSLLKDKSSLMACINNSSFYKNYL